jgi:hypothetical protein
VGVISFPVPTQLKAKKVPDTHAMMSGMADFL